MTLIRVSLPRDAFIDDATTLCGRLRPGCWLIESGYEPPPRHDPARLLEDRTSSRGMALSLTSATAIRLVPGSALIARLAELGMEVGPLAALALHELIANAAIHGNLAVASGRADAWRDLSERQDAIAAALDDPVRAARLLTIAFGRRDDEMIVAIADEGDGYDASAVRAKTRAAGRGLRIARAAGRIAVGDGGRRTTIALPVLSVPPSPASSAIRVGRE